MTDAEQRKAEIREYAASLQTFRGLGGGDLLAARIRLLTRDHIPWLLEQLEAQEQVEQRKAPPLNWKPCPAHHNWVARNFAWNNQYWVCTVCGLILSGLVFPHE